MGARARNDQAILDLLAKGRVVVKEDPDDLVKDSEGNPRPRTKVYLKHERDGKLRGLTAYPRFTSGHPYFCLHSRTRRNKQLWVSARRLVWYAFEVAKSKEDGRPPKRTSRMVCPIDGNPWNFNIWNLCLRDQAEADNARGGEYYKEQEEAGTTPEPGESSGYMDGSHPDIPF